MDFIEDCGQGGALRRNHPDRPSFSFLPLALPRQELMPAHSWLPGAMVAPTPVSALLHAVAVVKVGVFCIYRIYADVFGAEVLSNMGGRGVDYGGCIRNDLDILPHCLVTG